MQRTTRKSGCYTNQLTVSPDNLTPRLTSLKIEKITLPVIDAAVFSSGSFTASVASGCGYGILTVFPFATLGFE